MLKNKTITKMFAFLSVISFFTILSSISPTDVNEDAILSVPQLIKKYDYPVEIHHVITEDGYTLELHRIPYGKGCGHRPNKLIVFLQHGLLSSSADWIIAGPENGLGYLLADRCYDVWMGNARGNRYSKVHNELDPNLTDFWDFSWHEIGVYDLSVMIDYCLSEVGQKKLFYIGHSQGATCFFVLVSEKPEYNSRFFAQFSLAPLVYMKHTVSPLLRIISKFEDPDSNLLAIIGAKDFVPKEDFLAFVGQAFCGSSSITRYACTNPLFVLSGVNETNLNTELLPVIMGHTPAGSSTRQLQHYAQEIISGKFRHYDYGNIENILYYKNLEPSNYKLHQIRVPVVVFYSINDQMSAAEDVLRFNAELQNPYSLYLIPDADFNHLDFIWGKHVKDLVYDELFVFLSRFQ